jgi:ribosomal protein L24
MKVQKNDNVIVIAGKDRGKKGKVRNVNPKSGRVVVEDGKRARYCHTCSEIID